MKTNIFLKNKARSLLQALKFEMTTLDDGIIDFLSVINSAGKTDMSTLTPEDLRAGPDACANHVSDSYDDLIINNTHITSDDDRQIAIRTYKHPDCSDDRPTLIYVHGGCWVFCSLDTHDRICQYLSKHGNFKVVSVDYRLAPENKFPAGLEDVYEVAKHYKDDKLILCGDSAGGNMATVVSMMARDRKEFEVDLQVLFYPITDISNFDTNSYKEFSEGHLLTKDLMMWSGEKYIRNDSDRTNPYVSPLLSDNLKNLPPTYIVTAEADVLRDEAESYAEKLSDSGNKVEMTCYNGMIHAFVGMAGKISAGKEALDDSIAFISKTI